MSWVVHAIANRANNGNRQLCFILWMILSLNIAVCFRRIGIFRPQYINLYFKIQILIKKIYLRRIIFIFLLFSILQYSDTKTTHFIASHHIISIIYIEIYHVSIYIVIILVYNCSKHLSDCRSSHYADISCIYNPFECSLQSTLRYSLQLSAKY